jgi:hypothetical protein
MNTGRFLFHIIPSILTGAAGVLWPMWVMDGTFDDSIITGIGSFIAIYGGFIANAIWIYQNWHKK